MFEGTCHLLTGFYIQILGGSTHFCIDEKAPQAVADAQVSAPSGTIDRIAPFAPVWSCVTPECLDPYMRICAVRSGRGERPLSALRVGLNVCDAASKPNVRFWILGRVLRRTAIGQLSALHVAAGLVSIPYLPSSLYYRMMRRCRLRLSLERSRSAIF